MRAAPLLVGDILVVAGRQGRVAGLNPESGEPAWALPIELGKTLLADPLAEGDVVYYSAQGGDLFKVMPEEGSAVPLSGAPATPLRAPRRGDATPAPAASPTAGGTAAPSPTQAATP